MYLVLQQVIVLHLLYMKKNPNKTEKLRGKLLELRYMYIAYC